VLNRLTTKMFALSVFVAVLGLAQAPLALAAAERPSSAPGGISLPPGDETQQTYGAAPVALWLPAAAFSAHDSTVTFTRVSAGGGAKARTGGTGQFWAEVNLPNGALVTRVEVHHFDNSAANSGFSCFTRYVSAGGTFPLEETCSVFPAGTPGNTVHAYVPSAALTTIDNRNPYVVHIFVDGNNPAYHFYGVRVVYRLQLSAAPAVATFPNDVPTTHPFFRFVEMLAASGVTGGCGAGLFCPDQPVTRAQMSAFLAVMLGLHFPDPATIP